MIVAKAIPVHRRNLFYLSYINVNDLDELVSGSNEEIYDALMTVFIENKVKESGVYDLKVEDEEHGVGYLFYWSGEKLLPLPWQE
jgi:hypothetical protein